MSGMSGAAAAGASASGPGGTWVKPEAGGGSGSYAAAQEEQMSDNVFVSDLPADIDEASLQALFEQYAEVKQCKVLSTTVPGGKRSGLVRFGSAEHAKAIVDNLNGNIPQGMQSAIRCKFARSQDKGKGCDMKGGKMGCMKGKGGPYPMAMGCFGKGDFGKGDFGKGDFGKGDFGKGDFGKGGFGKGDWGDWGDWGMGGMDMMGPCWGKGCMKGGKGMSKGGTVKELLDLMEKAGAIPNAKQAADGGVVYVRGLPKDTTHFELYRMFAPFGSISSVHAMWHEDGTCKGFGFCNFLDASAAALAIQTLNGFQNADGQALEVSYKSPPKNNPAEAGGMQAAMTDTQSHMQQFQQVQAQAAQYAQLLGANQQQFQGAPMY
eukprot:TRINITY_DN1463_c0_g2_i1.p1 TRINITY_DN1463_c0_g2~~TRINITY_DN1463_c0_g2_i1.p1  ORF type:complete len:377 (-),score=124.80 TRINITY_DN1463_c0_g2_i1:52-1182(-)